MAEVSEQVGNRLKWTRFLLSSWETTGSAAEAKLDAQYSGLGGYVAGVFAALASVLLAMLDRRTKTMRQKEVALAAELTDDDTARSRRDQAVEEVRERLFRARAAIEGGFGEKVAVLYGLAGTPPMQPDALVAFAENALNLLAETPRSEQDLFGNTIDTANIAQAVQVAVDELEVALGAVNTETREEHAARVERDEAVSQWEQTYRGVGEVLCGLYRLAGRPDLAERVRPTIRSSQGKSEPPEGGDEPVVSGDDVVEPVEA